MGIQTVRPQNRKEFMSKLVGPEYDPKEGKIAKPFSEPTKLGQPEQNRAKEISVKGDREKDFYIGIKDLDEAVNYYFTNVLKLYVIQNNTRIAVPILYGSPENWKSIQNDGFYRDTQGKLMAPLLVFKRKSITQNRGLGYKLDGNLAHNIQAFKTSFNKRNYYSNFNVLNSRTPEQKYVMSVTPDYVTVEYDCVVFTYFVEQMDKLIEALNYASRSYWGDPNRFQFMSSIETFSDDIAYATGDNRAVRSTFGLTLNGYLIPEGINKAMSSANVYYGASTVKFALETTSGVEEFGIKTKQAATSGKSGILASDSKNVVNNITNTFADFDPAIVTYLNTNKSVTGTVANSNTVTFANAWLTAPASMPATTAANFTFFVNGQFVEPTSITSFTNGSTLVLNTAALGYTLEADDVVLAIGKFA